MRLFLDANVFFAGCLSPEGASAFILELARRKRIEIAASRLVLREADRNLRRKAPAPALKTFHQFLQQVKVRVILLPTDEEIVSPYEAMVHPKDLPVLSSAIASKSDYFLTLDRKHFLSSPLVQKLKKPVILGPANFIQNIYLKGKV